jgi:uncharacterized FAD-dependent dehydrogenase
MRYNITYTPSIGSLAIVDASLTADDLARTVSHYDNEACWTLYTEFLDGRFVGFGAMGVRTEALDWNLMLSLYLPDKIVATIADLLLAWDEELTAVADFQTRLFTRHEVTLRVIPLEA